MRPSLPPLALLSLTTLGAPPTLPPFAPPLRCSTIALPLAARADVVIGSRGVWDELLTSAVAGIVRVAQNASAASKLVVEQSATAGKAYMVHETADGAAYHGASPRRPHWLVPFMLPSLPAHPEVSDRQCPLQSQHRTQLASYYPWSVCVRARPRSVTADCAWGRGSCDRPQSRGMSSRAERSSPVRPISYRSEDHLRALLPSHALCLALRWH